MNLLHLFTASVFALAFAATPAPSGGNSKELNPTAVITPKDDDDYLPWADAQRLTWDDFLCEPKRGTDAVASTSTSLGIAYQMQNGKFTYHITCNFSRTKSWGLMKTDYILAHEQGHFDITEIFARKLNEALQHYDFNKKTFKKDINDIYQDIVSQKEAYQKAYDEETDHSRKRKVQYDWLNTIQKLLDETEAFSSYP